MINYLIDLQIDLMIDLLITNSQFNVMIAIDLLIIKSSISN